MATIWPWQWDACIAAVRAGRGTADPAWRAGRMLGRLDELSLYALDSISPDYGGGFVDVQTRFTAGELAAAAGSGDPVLAAAAAAAGPGGRVTQYLAGVPGLLSRYADPGGDPGGRAILTAAMDATRLGHSGPLPAGLLEQAAAGYLSAGAPAWPPARAGTAGRARPWPGPAPRRTAGPPVSPPSPPGRAADTGWRALWISTAGRPARTRPGRPRCGTR